VGHPPDEHGAKIAERGHEHDGEAVLGVLRSLELVIGQIYGLTPEIDVLEAAGQGVHAPLRRFPLLFPVQHAVA